jgi:hypothetical protein
MIPSSLAFTTAIFDVKEIFHVNDGNVHNNMLCLLFALLRFRHGGPGVFRGPPQMVTLVKTPRRSPDQWSSLVCGPILEGGIRLALYFPACSICFSIELVRFVCMVNAAEQANKPRTTAMPNVLVEGAIVPLLVVHSSSFPLRFCFLLALFFACSTKI